MLSLEEYIERRKKEDNMNEFDPEQRMENLRISTNYVFEYFNQYLDIEKMEQKTFLDDERLKKFRNQVKKYDDDVQDWLVHIYDNHEKHIHRSIMSFLRKDQLFLLYHREDEFRACSYDCYASLIKRNPFLRGHNEKLYRFIKDHHRIEGNLAVHQPNFLTEDIHNWIESTWNKYKVNLWAFASDYVDRFYENVSMWPKKHTKRVTEPGEDYVYDHKQKHNLFNLNTLYPKISNKPFMKRKKQKLEVIMMYLWLDNIVGDEDNYWELYISQYE